MILFAGIGTSDMEVAIGIVRPLTGVGLGIVGIAILAIGASILGANS